MQGTTRTADRRQTSAVVLAALLGLALVAAMITRTSEAAFTATTDNTGNTFSAGTITLTDDDTVTAMFNVAGMEPGDIATGCIEVTYGGTIAAPQAVKLYSSGTMTDVGGTNGLSTHLLLTIEEGSGATFNDCSTFTPGTTLLGPTSLADFNSLRTSYADGVVSWIPTATDLSRSYRMTVELDGATPNSEQGASTENLGFVWEVQS